MSHVRKWEGTENTFNLDFGDYSEGVFSFSTNEGSGISQYLSDYLDFVQRTVMSTQTFNHQLSRYPPDKNNFFLSERNAICCWENGKRTFTAFFLYS